MKEILIRPATNGDAGLIADMSRKTFYETFAAVNTKTDMEKFMDEQFTTEALIREVEEGDGYFYLAFDNNTAAGYARMRDGDSYPAFNNKPGIEIARLYALQEAIGKGVGSALIKHCMDVAQLLQRQIIWLGVWEKNERAIAFYTKWGFKKFDEHEFVLGNDVQTDWLMKKVF